MAQNSRYPTLSNTLPIPESRPAHRIRPCPLRPVPRSGGAGLFRAGCRGRLKRIRFRFDYHHTMASGLQYHSVKEIIALRRAWCREFAPGPGALNIQATSTSAARGAGNSRTTPVMGSQKLVAARRRPRAERNSWRSHLRPPDDGGATTTHDNYTNSSPTSPKTSSRTTSRRTPSAPLINTLALCRVRTDLDAARTRPPATRRYRCFFPSYLQ